MVKAMLPEGYPELLQGIKDRVRSAQYEALKAVNKELIALYWDIGRMIVERQKGDTWGKAVVERLAADLQVEFTGMQGFSVRNMWYMRNFYSTYSDKSKLQPLVAETGWYHNLIILDRCKDDLEREFYIKMTHKFGWSKNVLANHIEKQSYEKTHLGQTNFDKTLPDTRRLLLLTIMGANRTCTVGAVREPPLHTNRHYTNRHHGNRPDVRS